MIHPGDQVGRFKVVSPLGQGGMGVVFVAEDPRVERRVAVKVLRDELCGNKDTVERFFYEARLVNRIRHEHIVEITELDTLPSGESYYVMELLEGQSLRDLLTREPAMPLARALHIAEQVADALGAAHDLGVVHRDLKPDNVYLISRSGDPEYVKLLDFGIAKLLTEESGRSHRTRTGAVIGTASYMSPEQALGKSGTVDGRSDVYSLAVMLHEMLTGKLPFEAEGWGELLLMHVTQPFPSLLERRPELSPVLDAVLQKAAAKKAEDRHGNMFELREALLEHLDEKALPRVSKTTGRGGGVRGPSPRPESSSSSSEQATPASTPAGPPSASPVSGSAPTSPAPGRGGAEAFAATAAAGPAAASASQVHGEAVAAVPSSPATQPAPGSRGWSVLLAGVAIAAIGVTALLYVGPWKKPPTPTAEVVPATAPGPDAATVAPAAAPAAPAPPEPPPAPAPAAAVAPPPPASTMVTLKLQSQPDGAEVYRFSDGIYLGKTPIEQQLPASLGQAVYLFKMTGHQDERVEIPTIADSERRVTLKPAAHRRTRGGSKQVRVKTTFE